MCDTTSPIWATHLHNERGIIWKWLKREGSVTGVSSIGDIFMKVVYVQIVLLSSDRADTQPRLSLPAFFVDMEYYSIPPPFLEGFIWPRSERRRRDLISSIASFQLPQLAVSA